MKIKAILGTLALLSAAFANTAMAVEKGDWLVRFGASNVKPASDNHSLVDVESAWSATANLSYMFTDNLSVELLAAWPFEHDIRAGGEKVARTRHLPPTVSVQYHFMPQNPFKPYVGLGVNYTMFFNEDSVLGPMDLDDSWGLAGEIGVDIMLGDTWFLNASARYIDIDTKGKVGPIDLGTINIDPMVYGLNLGLKF
ncbi:MAG: OmpW family outer membrane protein [Xanthomonadales bacterium]